MRPSDRVPRILRQLDDLRTIVWRQRASILVFRTIWLAFLVLDVWLALYAFTVLRPSPAPFIALFVATFALGATLVALARPSRGQMARTLDRSFGLRERIATALEQTHGRRLAGLPALQVVDATRVTNHVSKAHAFGRRLPVREILLAFGTVALCVILVAVLVSWGITPFSPGTSADQGIPPALPGNREVPGAGQSPGSAAGGQDVGQGANGQQRGGSPQPGQDGQHGQGQQGNTPTAQGQRDLDAVSGALSDHAATRDAANRIQAGDYQGAADSLRDAARNADQMSPDARRGLADDLREAADQVSDPQLRQDLHDAADALDQPGAAGAQDGLDRVADDIERIGQGQSPDGQAGAPTQPQNGSQGQNDPSGAGGGPGAGQGLPGDQRQGPSYGQSTPPLGADGQPIELPKGDSRGPLIPSQGQGGSGGGPTEPGSTTAGGGQLRQNAIGESGPDANHVPLDQRGTVERYFTPRQDEPEP